MPFSFRIDDDLDLLFLEADGLLTPDRLHDCIEEYVAAPGFRPGLDVLLILGGDAFVEIGGHEESPVVLAAGNVLDETKEALALARKGVPHRVACVGGPSKTRTFAIAALGLMDGQSEIAAFEDTVAALEWLGREGAPTSR